MDRARQTDLLARPAATSRRGRRATPKAGPIPNTSTISLTVVLGEGGALPTEFRIFVAGVNETTKGSFLFDEEAAASVMATYAARANDIAIDLEHQMLDSRPQPDPTARDARGACRLELRDDGSLWAIGVTWTPDGAQRLTEKRQRYISPAFAADPETGRVISILNIAICAIPATHGTPALVAASATGDTGMSVEEFLKVCKALGIDMGGSLEDAMAKIKGEKPGNAAEDAADGGADDAQETPVAAAAEAAPPKPEEDKPAETAAALSAITTLSGKPSLVASVADIRTWHASHVAHETNLKALADREAVIESAERRKLCVELVTLGGHRPSTVWADDKSTAPKPYLLSMPIADLRAMHADAVKASGGKPATAIKPPATGSASADGSKDIAIESGDLVTLSAREVRLCGNDPARMQKYAATRAGIRARNVNGTGV